MVNFQKIPALFFKNLGFKTKREALYFIKRNNVKGSQTTEDEFKEFVNDRKNDNMDSVINQLKQQEKTSLKRNQQLSKKYNTLVNKFNKLKEQLKRKEQPKKIERKVKIIENKIDAREGKNFKNVAYEYVIDMSKLPVYNQEFVEQNEVLQTAIDNQLRGYVQDLNRIKRVLINNLRNTFNKLGTYKYYLTYECELFRYKKTKNENNEETVTIDNLVVFYLSHESQNPNIVLNESEIIKSVNQSYNRIKKLIESATSSVSGSGWIFKRSIKMHIDYVKYEPIKGGSFKKLPDWVINKRCCINIENKDNKCFFYSVIASKVYESLQNKKHSSRVSNYKDYMNLFDFSMFIHEKQKLDEMGNVYQSDDCSIAIDSNRFDKFCQINKVCLSIFDIEDSNNRVKPIYASRMKEYETEIDIGYYDGHYVLIRNLSALLGNEKIKNKMYHCKNCLNGFWSQEKLQKHKLDCMNNDSIRVIMPFSDNDKQLKFKSYHKMVKASVAIYCDFECIIDENKNHIPSGYALYAVSQFCEPELLLKRGKDGDDTMNKFFSDLKRMEFKYMNFVREKEQEIVKHFKIPVVIHNLRGYDSHIIIKYISRYGSENIDCIANNKEKYMSFTIDGLRFIDSLQFMASSLETLVKNLKKDVKNDDDYLQKFKYTTREFGLTNADIITRKQVYPYEYFDSFEKFDDKDLPSIDLFYSSLYDSSISESDYEQAKHVYKYFNCQSLGQYHDLYLKSDVTLLADVFESFRNVCHNAYGLDPINYITAPSLAWDAMLLKTGITIENMTDIDMFLMAEKGLRGGICSIQHRHSKANNKYLTDYNPQQESNYIMYLDANNLYGWAMIQSLPSGNYKWEKIDDMNEQFIMSLAKDCKRGYIFEVDLEYPVELHDSHNDYPLAPESTSFNSSPFMQQIETKYDIKQSDINKLIPNLHDKKNYVVHYRNLQLYLSLGLKLTKIHRVFSFEQSDFLKSYIDMNTDMRKNAKNDFEKDFFKLMNNSVFGKFMENIRKRKDVHLLQTAEQVLKKTKQSFYDSHKIFSDDLIAVEMKKKHIVMNKPIVIGMCILDLSKYLMYDFHYNTMKTKYGDKCKVMYTDTDSLIYEIKTEDVYQDLAESNFKKNFDFSDYPQNHPLHDETNKKVIGKFKCETNGKVIDEYVGLCPKMYSVLVDNEAKMRAKGVGRSAMKNIMHENYKSCLFDSNQFKQYCKFNSIKSENHQLKTVEINKVSLSAYDDKRYYIDMINSYAYGHYKSLN